MRLGNLAGQRRSLSPFAAEVKCLVGNELLTDAAELVGSFYLVLPYFSTNNYIIIIIKDVIKITLI